MFDLYFTLGGAALSIHSQTSTPHTFPQVPITKKGHLSAPSTSTFLLYVCLLAVIDALILLLELLQTAGLSQNAPPLASVERVARRTNTYADFLHGRTGHESISAGTSNFAFLVLRVNILLHVYSLLVS